jgi:hypothetical protein
MPANNGSTHIKPINVSKSSSEVSLINDAAVNKIKAKRICKYLIYFFGSTHLLIIDLTKGNNQRAIIPYFMNVEFCSVTS